MGEQAPDVSVGEATVHAIEQAWVDTVLEATLEPDEGGAENASARALVAESAPLDLEPSEDLDAIFSTLFESREPRENEDGGVERAAGARNETTPDLDAI